jgi:hypothetical protein
MSSKNVKSVRAFAFVRSATILIPECESRSKVEKGHLSGMPYDLKKFPVENSAAICPILRYKRRIRQAERLRRAMRVHGG